ncbi:MAG: hypothetical protein U0457_08705 [Candidatus Sericytochromatia bacterium]
MKKSLLFLLPFLIVSFSCATKKTTVIPSTAPTASGGPDTQNYTPTTAGTQPNQAYYGNGAVLTNDTTGFNNTPTASTAPTTGATDPSATTATDPSASTSTATGATSATDDLGINLPNAAPYVPPGGVGANTYTYSDEYLLSPPSTSAIGATVGAFLPSVDKWQAVGVVSNGANIFISAVGTSNFAFSSGTVLSMNAETGKDVKKVGSTLLGTRNPLSKEVRGIGIDSSNKIYGTDGKNIYSVGSSLVITDSGLAGAIDTVVAGTSVIVATSNGIKKYDPTTLTGKAVATGTDFAKGVMPTGGMGLDKDGNLYVIAGSVVKKVTPAGEVSDIVKDVSGAVDVAVDGAKRICVLFADSIKAYDDKGKDITTFGSGEFAAGKALAVSGATLFVADFGTSYKDSKIVKYSIAAV